ncbi:hypothetical protein I204_01463 [Kwoniella mangroviensis CBS 8886]|nr:hypothetical protein I204_01463 [Kwoniella mangroviensis CBS 8886]
MKVAVFTVTGDQGSNVAKYLLEDREKKYQVLGITRNVNSEKAQALESEKKDSIGAIDACVKADVDHIVYSTLDEVDKGECPHYESKNAAEGGDEWLLDVPAPDDLRIPGYPAEQTGLWVKEAFDNRDKWLGKNIYASTSSPTPLEMAQSLSLKFNVKVTTAKVTLEQFHTDEHKQKIGEELWLAYKVILNGKMYHAPETIAVLPGAWTFEDWIDQDQTLKQWFSKE